MANSNAPIVVRGEGLTIPDTTTRIRENSRPHGVPPSISENVFTTPLAFTDDEFVALSKTTLKAMRETAEKCRTLATSVLADATRTPLAAQRDTDAAVSKLVAPTLERAQKTIERLHAKQLALTDYLRGPATPKDAPGVLSQMEVRTALAQMPAADRRKLVLAGIEAGDVTVTACLRSAPFLSGINPLEQEEYRMRWAHKNHPGIVAQLEIIGKALDAVERGGKLLLDYSLSLTNRHEVTQAKELSARAQAAIAAGAGE